MVNDMKTGMLKGWSELLYNYVLEDNHNLEEKYRSREFAIVLSLISRLHIKPTSNFNCMALASSLCNFLLNVKLNGILADIPSLSRLKSLKIIVGDHWEPYHHSRRGSRVIIDDDESDSDECRIDSLTAVPFRKHSNLHHLPFAPSVRIFCVDTDGFSSSFTDFNASLEFQSLTSHAVEVLHRRYLGDIEDKYTLFEIVSFIISIIPRLCAECSVNAHFVHFEKVLSHFTSEILSSSVRLMDCYECWDVLSSFLIDASLRLIRSYSSNEACCEAFREAVFICLTRAADQIMSSMKDFIDETDEDDLQRDIPASLDFRLIFRYLNAILYVVNIRIFDLSFRYYGIQNAIRELFFDIIRDAFILNELVVNEVNRKLCCDFISTVMHLNSMSIRAEKYSSKKVDKRHISGGCTAVSGDRCYIKFSLEILTEIVQNCTQSALLDKILECARSLRKGLCACTNPVLMFSLISEKTMDSLLKQLIMTLSYHLESCWCQRIDVLPEKYLKLFVRKIRGMDVRNDMLIIKFFYTLLPYISESDSQLILDQFISQMVEMKLDLTSGIVEYPFDLIDLLKDHVKDVKCIENLLRSIVAPRLLHANMSLEYFIVYFELSESILFNASISTFASLEVQCFMKAINGIYMSELGLAEADIWQYMSSDECFQRISHVLNLMEILSVKYKSCEDNETEGYSASSLAWFDVCIDWIQVPSIVPIEIRRFGRIFSYVNSILLRQTTESCILRILEKRLIPSLMNRLLDFRLIGEVLCGLIIGHNLRALRPCAYLSWRRGSNSRTTRPLKLENGFTSKQLFNYPYMVLFVIRALDDFIKKCPSILSSDAELCLNRICSTLGVIISKLPTKEKKAYIDKIIPEFVKLTDSITLFPLPSRSFSSVLNLYKIFLGCATRTLLLKSLLSIIRKSPNLQFYILEAILELIVETPSEPIISLVFPQKQFDTYCGGQVSNSMVIPVPYVWTCFNQFAKVSHELSSDKHVNNSPHGLSNGIKRKWFPRTFLLDDCSTCDANDNDVSVEQQLSADIFVSRWMDIKITDGLSVSFWLRITHSNLDDVDGCMYAICALGCMPYNFYLIYCRNRESLCVRYRCNGKRKNYFLSPVVVSRWMHIVLSITGSDRFIYEVNIDGKLYKFMTVNDSCSADTSSDSIQFAFGTLVRAEISTSSLRVEVTALLAFRGISNLSNRIILRALGYENVSVLYSQRSTIFVPIVPPIKRNLGSKCGFSVSNQWDKEIVQLQRRLLFWLKCSLINSEENLARVEIIMKIEDETQSGKVMLKSFTIHLSSETILRHNCDFDHIILSNGGIRLFIYLFAQAVDMKADSITVALALRLLKASTCRYITWEGECSESEINVVIKRCLASPLCSIDHLITAEILRFSVTGLQYKGDGISPTVTPLSIICDADFLTNVICCADIWRDSNRFMCWLHIISIISMCINEDNLFIDVNLRMLHQANFLQSFFNVMEEIIRDFSSLRITEMKEDLVDPVVAIVNALMYDSADLDNMKSLWRVIFISSSTQTVVLSHDYQRRNIWFDKGFLSTETSYLSEHSELAASVDTYAKVLGRDVINRSWTEKRSVIFIRNIFNDRLKKDSSDNDSLSNSENSLKTAARSELSNTSAAMYHCFSQQNRANGSGGKEQESSEISRFSADDASDMNSNLISIASWITHLQSNLLQILTRIVQNGSDHLITPYLKGCLKWQTILSLLSDRGSEKLRDCIYQLMEIYSLRSGPEFRASFSKSSGFCLIANQIRGFPISTALINCAFSFICGDTVRLEEGLDYAHLESLVVDKFNCESFRLIFAIWEESVLESTIAAFWNISSALSKIYEANSFLMQAMMDANLCETLVSVLRRIAILSHRIDSTDHISVISLLECWETVARRVILSCVPFGECNHFEMCKQFISLLSAALASFHSELNAKYILRTALCMVLRNWIDSIRDVYLDEEASIISLPSYEPLSESLGENNSSSKPSQKQRRSLFDLLNDYQFYRGREVIIKPVMQICDKLQSTHGYLRCSYKSRLELKPVSFAIMVDRFLFCLESMNNLFSFLQPESEELLCEQEDELFQLYLGTIYISCRKDNVARIASNQTAWLQLIMTCRHQLRKFFLDVIRFLLFSAEEKMRKVKLSSLPAENTSMRKRRLIIDFLVQLIQQNILANMLHDSPLDHKHTLNLALHELAINGQLCSKTAKNIDESIRFLRFIQIESPFVRFTPERQMALSTDEWLALNKYIYKKQGFFHELRHQLTVIDIEEQSFVNAFRDVVISVMQIVADDQNSMQQTYIKNKRLSDSDNNKAEAILSELLKDFNHPETICHDESSWPSSLALDPTEGPNREKRRLMFTHLSFDQRFLQSESIKKLETRTKLNPLSDLLSKGRINARVSSFVHELTADEHIIFSACALMVRSTVENIGETVITNKKLHFYADVARSVQKGVFLSASSNFIWEYDDIIEIFDRFHLLKDVALELFCLNRQTFLFVFDDNVSRNEFKARLLSMDLKNSNKLSDSSLNAVTLQWREGRITNFSYLMHLNKLAGRTYNDLMQYPVFPFILSVYSSKLDLNDPASYRDLSKPIAIQHKRMEDHYIRNYKYLLNEQSKVDSNCKVMYGYGPYHYGSHYSNSGIVIHYLVRLPPFTDIALEYQDHNFDIPDRLFNSVEAAWKLASSESTTDFKELIPEFFYLPEFLINIDQLNLGTRQDGSAVNDVILPEWCQNSARLFILVHRQALESRIVTSNLHYWIDLIFGYKQTGEAAVQAINVFHPVTYRGGIGAGNSADVDEISSMALRTMVRTYGQMPGQLFNSAHQPHFPIKAPSKFAIWNPLRAVMGVQWGEFLGSPGTQYGPTIVVFDKLCVGSDGHISHAESTADGSCYAYPHHTLLISRKVRLSEVIYGQVSWRFSDNLLRYKTIDKLCNEWIDLVDLYSFSVTAISYCSSYNLLFVALSCALIHVYRVIWHETVVQDFYLEKSLFGHSSIVCAISCCAEYAISVTACRASKVCVWDLNDLSHTRTLNGEESSSSAVLITISKVSCDVAVVFECGRASRVCLYTINGSIIGKHESDIAITSMAMTALHEGTAINVLAVGMLNGTIRIFEMWTFSHIQTFVNNDFLEPIISMSFTNKYTRLYTCSASGRILCWQGAKCEAKEPSVIII